MANSASNVKSTAQSEKIGSPYLAAVRCRFSLIAIYSKFGKQRTLENDAKLKLPRVKVKDEAKKSAKTCCFGSKGKLLQLLRLQQTAFFYFFASELSPAFCSQTIACLEKQNKKTNFCHFGVQTTCILPLCITLPVCIKKRVVPSVTILNSYRSPICSLLEYRAHRHNCM